MIEVVSAILIVRFPVSDGRVTHPGENRILLTQRRPDKDFPFLWEAPGGKVAPGERATDALTRELCEEVGALIPSDYFSEVTAVTVQTPKGDAVVKFFAPVGGLSTKEKVCLRPREGQGIGWFTSGEMVRLPLVPGNRKALAKIVELLRVKP